MMIKKPGLLIYCFLFIGTFQLFSQEVWLVDPLDPIYPDRNALSQKGYQHADFPSSAPVDIHLVVSAQPGQKISISALLDGLELPVQYWSQLRDVPVEQNTGLDSRTEQFINKINPHVIRRAPFQIYEIIEPMESKTVQVANTYDAFRLEIPASLGLKPGKHKIEIRVSGSSFQKEISFTAKVFEGTLPPLSEGNFFYTNWFNLNKMESYHGVERWTMPWYQMLDKYARLMAHGRQNCVIIPGELIRYENGVFSLDGDRMIAFIDVFRKHGFQYFESPHLMYRGDGDDWGAAELKVHLTKNGYFSPEGKKDVQEILKLIRDFTQKNNLIHQWLQHIADEPTSANAQCYKDVVAQVKEIYPEIQIMEATNDRDGIAGAIDMWCPLINDFQENEDFFRAREKLGEKVLVYTCLIPGGRWLNRTMDMEKLRQVYFGWGASHYNTFGYLHWGLNQYIEDPFSQSVVHHPSPVASANNFLPAGDTHVVYPGKNGPLSSLRFEAHRIGVEDFEILRHLKARNQKKHDRLVSKLFRSYTDYNLSVKDYRKGRRKLLKSMEG